MFVLSKWLTVIKIFYCTLLCLENTAQRGGSAQNENQRVVVPTRDQPLSIDTNNIMDRLQVRQSRGFLKFLYHITYSCEVI